MLDNEYKDFRNNVEKDLDSIADCMSFFDTPSSAAVCIHVDCRNIVTDLYAGNSVRVAYCFMAALAAVLDVQRDKASGLYSEFVTRLLQLRNTGYPVVHISEQKIPPASETEWEKIDVIELHEARETDISKVLKIIGKYPPAKNAWFFGAITDNDSQSFHRGPDESILKGIVMATHRFLINIGHCPICGGRESPVSCYLTHLDALLRENDLI